jgi:hypothetical protein
VPLENYRLLPEIQLEVNGTAVKGQDSRGRRIASPRGAIHIRSVEQAYPYCFLVSRRKRSFVKEANTLIYF